MKIILCDLQSQLVIEWVKVFHDYPDVQPINYDILKVVKKADAMVTAGNSLGFCTGGVDLVFAKYFGPHLQATIQSQIQIIPGKELPVGTALVVPTKNESFPNLIYAPTMRVPMDISKTLNVYLAFKAILGVANFYNFQTIVCPGLGTSTGRVHPKVCAMQMKEAYLDHINDYFPASLEEAMELHVKLTDNNV